MPKDKNRYDLLDRVLSGQLRICSEADDLYIQQLAGEREEYWAGRRRARQQREAGRPPDMTQQNPPEGGM